MQVQDSQGKFVAKGDIITFVNVETAAKQWAIYVGNQHVVFSTPIGVREMTLDEVVQTDLQKENILDNVKEPRKAYEIVERALGHVGKEPPVTQLDDGGHGFVIWCRYGKTPSNAEQRPDPQAPIVGVDSSGCVLQPADAVRFDCGPFSHWAVYVGNGAVIHMTAKGVVEQNLLEVANENPFYKDNSMDAIQRPFMTEGILSMARTRLGDRSYNYFNNNCETFVNQVRCGNAKSRQVSEYLERNNVGSFHFTQAGPQGMTQTFHVMSNGGHHTQSHSMSSSSSTASSGPGYAQRFISGPGAAASAVSSGPGGVFTSSSPPGAVVMGQQLPQPPPNMERDLYCYGCHAGVRNHHGNL